MYEKVMNYMFCIGLIESCYNYIENIFNC